MRKPLPIFRLTIYVSTALAILWLSLSPNPYLPEEGLFSWDKAQHSLAYAVLALLGGWALQPLMDGLRPWRWGALIAVTYGTLMEIAQMFLTRGRSGQMGDVLANATGALAVYLLARLVIVSQGSRRQREVE